MRKCKFSASMKTMPLVYTTSVALMIFIASLVEGNIEQDEANCKPQHVHLAFGDSLVEMVVVWATLGPCSTELEFTTQPWAWDLNHRVVGNSSEFWEQNMEGLHYLHRVKLSGLQQTTTYYYRPLSNNIGSGPFYFKTPSTGVDWSPRLLVFGDLGVHSETVPSMVEEGLRGQYTALIHAGDFAYNLKDDQGQVGDQFMELIEPVAAFLPYMTCPGNHEIDSDTFTHYNHRFSMPESHWPMTPDKMWYSFNMGPAHFISYSSEVFFTQGGEYVKTQFDWLVKDLKRANANRDIRPWIIAFGHRPMYCSVSNQDDCTKNNSLVRHGLEELFYGFGVDIILEAHEHNYERLYPMYGGQVLATSYVDPPAPIHIISGAAGSKHGVDPFQMPPKPAWSAVRVEEGVLNSYGDLRVVNASHVYWEQRSVVTHTVLDSLWIVQNHHRKFLLANVSNTASSMSSLPSSNDDMSDLFADEDPEARQRELKRNDLTQRIAFGVSFGVLFTILIIAAVMTRACRKRRHYSTVRRWDASDLDYGRKLFSSTTSTAAPASSSSSAGAVRASKVRDDELDGEQDYEMDMGDMGAPSKKLLNNN